MTSFNNNIPTKFPALGPAPPNGDLLLANERAKASFDVKEMSKFMYTEEYLNKMYKVLDVLESEPAFDKSNRYHESRPEKIASSLWKDKRLVELQKYVTLFTRDSIILTTF